MQKKDGRNRSSVKNPLELVHRGFYDRFPMEARLFYVLKQILFEVFYFPVFKKSVVKFRSGNGWSSTMFAIFIDVVCPV